MRRPTRSTRTDTLCPYTTLYRAETASKTDRSRKGAGTLAGLRVHYKAVLQVLGLTAAGSLLFYTYTTYMQKYLVNTAGMNAKTASETMTVVLLVYMLMQPLFGAIADRIGRKPALLARSEEHTSELQSIMRISYAVFCLNKKRYTNTAT